MRTTVVIISSIHWHVTWQGNQEISWGLAEHDYDVIYLEPLPKQWPALRDWQRVLGRITESPERAGFCRQPEHPDVDLMSPFALPDYGLAGMGRLVNSQFFLPRLIRKLGRRGLSRPLVVINYQPTPSARAVARSLNPDLSIYVCIMDWANLPYNAGLRVSEQEMLDEVDLIFADSPYLINKMKRSHRNVIPVLPAVHVERFAEAQSNTSRKETPKCAYFGGIGLRVDVDLLRRVSYQFPLQLIGPTRTATKGFSDTTEFLGPVPHSQLPGLLRDADVLLLPYRRDLQFVQGIIPAKTFECLATGKPTVSIGLDSLSEYSDLFYLAETEEQFLDMIARAPSEDPGLSERRIACAHANSWRKRLEEIIGHIENNL